MKPQLPTQMDVTIQEAAACCLQVITRGEQVLDRAKEVAHGIEARVHDALEDEVPGPPHGGRIWATATDA
jgi:hypothetical protein